MLASLCRACSIARAHVSPPSRARVLSSSTAPSLAPPPPPRDVVGLVAFSALTALTAGLGAWQLVRYTQKCSLLETRGAAGAAEAVDVSVGPFPAELLDAEGAYRRVVVAGGSLARDVPVAVLTPRTPPPGLPGYLLTHANAGRQLVAPLTRRDGTRVLLLAGFVPSDVALPAGHVLPTALLAPAASGSPRPLAGLLQGVVRRSETPGQWGAVNSPGSGGMQGGELAGGRPFSFIDVPALAAACGLNASCGDVTDVLIEVVAPFPPAPVAGGAKDAAAQAATWPVTRQAPQFTSLITPSTHLIYAATWLTLATVGAVLTRQRFKPTRGAQRKMAMPSRRGRD